MASLYCPDCRGFGIAIRSFFAIPCPLCKANDTGNSHLRKNDLENQSYMEQWAKGESNIGYWLWLKSMVEAGHIDPDSLTKDQNE